MRLPLRIKVSHLLGLVAAVAVGLWLDSIPGGCACGEFGLDVTLNLPADRQIVSVAALVVSDRSFAEEMLKYPEGMAQECRQVMYVPDQPFEVSVPISHRMSSISGRPMSRYQARGVVLRLVYADGKAQLLAREIPDRRVSRSLTVVVP